MNERQLTIWSNQSFPAAVLSALIDRVTPHRLVFSPHMVTSNLAAGLTDPSLDDADVAFGQPNPDQVILLPNLRWIQLTTAGYTRYDTAAARTAFRKHGAILSTSSSVYGEPCAEHLLSMMLAIARQLPQSLQDQRSAPGSLNSAQHRSAARILVDQRVLIFGYGTIARRLVELLQPLRMEIICVRRRPRGDEGIRTLAPEAADTHLTIADHVVNILPQNADSDGYFDARRFALMKPGAIFYNIGRGTTVDHAALTLALQSGPLGAAYLDVTDPEPLPTHHSLWSLPNCFITPHSAGGSDNEFFRLTNHFVENLMRFTNGEPVVDRVI